MTTRTQPVRRRPTLSLDEIGCKNVSDLARRSGYPLRTIQRWKANGIPRNSADHLAIRLGLHPASIWTRWYETP